MGKRTKGKAETSTIKIRLQRYLLKLTKMKQRDSSHFLKNILFT